ncbi:arrestin domain-containing protein 3-like [Sabethes cyaneus]|uniref:arrestin domain-containing protein 3-like n=1 Tax=Sabethes cyaneus TaxID=53552 RepID=UPI00237D54B3|nr:arrestin domain-containing protein 3-like [Sabethes cyaneus]
MATVCNIKFNANSNGVYIPGQTVTGKVELHLTEATVLKGYHFYNFSCVLPSNLATSLESEQGYVRYTAKLVLERHLKPDQSFKIGFTVLRHVNLNHELRDVRLPARTEKTKTYCCGPCRSKPLYVSAQLPISGYVPGQTITVKITVENQTKKRVNEVSAKLLQVISFISKTPYCEISENCTTIAEVRCAGVEAHGNLSKEQYLLVPIVPPTSTSCPVLTVNYFVEVEGKIGGPNSNPRIRIPITIGTVPLSASAVPAFDEPAIAVVHQPNATVIPSLNDYYTLPPPSYEEATGAIRNNILDEEETDETTSGNYTPRYVFYHFGVTQKSNENI